MFSLILGDCDDSVPVTFIVKPPTNVFTLVGHDVLLHFKYKGIRINTYWLVNGTHNLSDISYIQNTVFDTYKCEEVYELKLLHVTHDYSGNFTAYASRGAFVHSALHLTVNLS